MRPAVQHDAPGGNAHSGDYIILLLELTIEGILGAVDIEGRRQIALGQPACIHISHAEAAIEGIDHACGGSIGENGVQLVRHIGAVQRRAGHIFVIVHQKFTGLNAARRKAHDGNVIWVNAIDLRIFADKTDGSRHIQRTFLLRIRRQAVIYDEGLKAQLSQCCGGGQRIGVVAPELISAARHQHHRAFWLHALPDGDSGDIVGWEALHMKKNYDDEQENTTAYRVRLLRQDRGWSQKELADKIFVAHSQISRLESGETTNIGSALLVSLAKVFHVSADYLLCLTPISVPKSYDISQLGLSEEVIRRLILKTIDPDVLNRLLEHDQFPKLCALMKNYFSNTVANGIMARNQIIDLATDPLAELMSADPSKRTEMIKDLSFLNSSKIQSNEADIEKIKNILMKIIRDVKENMAEEQPSGAVATAEAVKGIRAALPDKPQSELTADDVSTAITAYIGTMITMDENTSELFQQLAKQVLELPLDEEN